MKALDITAKKIRLSKIITMVIACLLAFLFLYTGISKILDPAGTYQGLRNQVFPPLLSEMLFYTLPPIELITAILLLRDSTIKAGLLVSSLLMTLFSAYILLVLTGIFGRIPCSCGGVLNSLGWWEHLWFNLVFLALAVVGLWVKMRETRCERLDTRN